MGNQHIIELNGKRYDALTGKIIADKPTPVTASKHAGQAKPHHIDGFSRPKSSAPRQHNPTASHPAQKSKTLMRSTVHKPAAKPHHSPAKTTHTVVKSTQHVVPSKRLEHAQSVPKSTLISRFGQGVTSAASDAKAALPGSKGLAVAHLRAAATAASVMTHPLAEGLARAQSHQEPKLSKPKRSARVARRLHIKPRLVSSGAFALALLLLGGFFAYQNMPNLKMKLASNRAGVHGTLPGYKPAGFNLDGAISYKPGQIIVGFKSTSDDRSFNLTQDTSAWDSESLRENYVASQNRDYQTIQDRGRTIYIYNGSNATWVDGGVWYRIEGNSELNSDQLLNMAASL